jgi:RNA polymerase sigma factor (sigma-70 family)
MDEANPFRTLMQRMLTGDNAAAQKILVDYGESLRVFIRRKLYRSGIHGLLDTADIFQSVMRRLWVGLNQIDRVVPESDKHLLNLLKKISTNKIRDEIDKARSKKRDFTRQQSGGDLSACPGREPDPSEALATREQFERVMDCLPPGDQLLYQLRFEQDLTWVEIGHQLGCTEDAARQRWSRACAEVRELVEEVSHA